MGRQTLYEQAEDALKDGVILVRLREKELDAAACREGSSAQGAMPPLWGPLIINDNVEVAFKSGANGVHVGVEDTPVAQIRAKMGKDFIIGARVKTVEQARKTQEGGAKSLSVGAAFPSPTRKTAVRITNERLRKICASVSAIFAAEDIKSATEHLKEKVIGNR